MKDSTRCCLIKKGTNYLIAHLLRHTHTNTYKQNKCQRTKLINCHTHRKRERERERERERAKERKSETENKSLQLCVWMLKIKIVKSIPQNDEGDIFNR